MNAAAVSGIRAAIESLKEDRAEIDSTIKGLELALARRLNEEVPMRTKSLKTPEVTGGAYLLQGATPTIKDILSKSDRPMTTREILNTAVKEGFTSNSQKPGNMFRSICERLIRVGILEAAQSGGKRAYKLKK